MTLGLLLALALTAGAVQRVTPAGNTVPRLPAWYGGLAALPPEKAVADLLKAAGAKAPDQNAKFVLGALAGRPLPAALPPARREALQAVVAQLQDKTRAQPQLAAMLDRLFENAPPARRDPLVEDYHGVPVPDPYRWMEDPNSEETKTFVAAQDAHTAAYFAKLKGLPALRKRVRRHLDYRRPTMPGKVGSYFIHSHNEGWREQPALYISATEKGPRRLLLDPLEFDRNGHAALASQRFSKDGKHMAFALSRNGSDWQEWRVRELETGKDLPEVLLWSKHGGADWKEDGSGFYYTRYEQPPKGQEYTAVTKGGKLYFHKLGTPQDQDELVHADPRGKAAGYAVQELDGRLIVQELPPPAPEAAAPLGGRVWIKDLRAVGALGLAKKDAGFKPLFDDEGARSEVIGKKDGTLFVLTDLGAPRQRLLAVDENDTTKWRVVIPEGPKGAVLASVSNARGGFIAQWIVHAAHQLEFVSLDGRERTHIPMPGLGSAYYSGNANGRIRYSYSSFLQPQTIYEFDRESGKTRVVERSQQRFDPKRFVAKRVFVKSKDGTKVPMWVVHKKGIKLNGSNPTYQYGYGGFDAAILPSFSGARMAFLERGSVFALINLRGGSEYGRDWHDQGRRGNKQNVFDDFVAGSEWLIRRGYARDNRDDKGTLSAGGSSNGGLLAGAVLNQGAKRKLYAAVVPDVGVLDMYRYQYFTVGAGWAGDYHLSTDPEGFKSLSRLSPLHNVVPGGDYAATLITTGDHDDRVVPSHSLKFAAELQRAQAGRRPILLHVQKNTGHGMGKSRSQLIESIATMWAFLLDQLKKR